MIRKHWQFREINLTLNNNIFLKSVSGGFLICRADYFRKMSHERRKDLTVNEKSELYEARRERIRAVF